MFTVDVRQGVRMRRYAFSLLLCIGLFALLSGCPSSITSGGDDTGVIADIWGAVDTPAPQDHAQDQIPDEQGNTPDGQGTATPGDPWAAIPWTTELKMTAPASGNAVIATDIVITSEKHAARALLPAGTMLGQVANPDLAAGAEITIAFDESFHWGAPEMEDVGLLGPVRLTAFVDGVERRLFFARPLSSVGGELVPPLPAHLQEGQPMLELKVNNPRAVGKQLLLFEQVPAADLAEVASGPKVKLFAQAPAVAMELGARSQTWVASAGPPTRDGITAHVYLTVTGAYELGWVKATHELQTMRNHIEFNVPRKDGHYCLPESVQLIEPSTGATLAIVADFPAVWWKTKTRVKAYAGLDPSHAIDTGQYIVTFTRAYPYQPTRIDIDATFANLPLVRVQCFHWTEDYEYQPKALQNSAGVVSEPYETMLTEAFGGPVAIWVHSMEGRYTDFQSKLRKALLESGHTFIQRAAHKIDVQGYLVHFDVYTSQARQYVEQVLGDTGHMVIDVTQSYGRRSGINKASGVYVDDLQYPPFEKIPQPGIEAAGEN